MFAEINTEGYLRIHTQAATESYALRVFFEKSPPNSGMILDRRGQNTILEIPEGYPKIKKKVRK